MVLVEGRRIGGRGRAVRRQDASGGRGRADVMQGGLVELGKRRPVKRLAAIAREGVPGHLIDRVLREVVNDARKRDRPAPFENRRRALSDTKVRLRHGRRLGQRRRGAVQLAVDVPRHKLPVMKALV